MQNRQKGEKMSIPDNPIRPMVGNYYPKKRSDVNVRVVDGETVALDRRNGFVHQFNETASYIWEQCDGRRSIRKIAGLLSEAFEIDLKVAAKDVAAVIQQLGKLGLLQS